VRVRTSFRAGFALALVLLASAAPAGSQDLDPAFATPLGRATIEPQVGKLGERITYRGTVVIPTRESVKFMPPRSDSLVTWGTPRTGRTKGAQGVDSVWIEIPFQVFETGVHTIPGLSLIRDPRPGDATPGEIRHLPPVQVPIIPTLTAADSNATLREVHGPLAAPWWERVPWMWVILGLLVAAAVVWLIRRLRRRKPVAAPAPALRPVVAKRDPVAEALADLRALKARRLPESGEFAEHAFVLGRILRRYLEATVAIMRPGDTTPELIQHLKLSSLADAEVLRLSGLLRVWDRIKFARDPFTVDEAHRAEDSVEAFVLASSPRRKEVA
jgi:hypothetical protein